MKGGVKPGETPTSRHITSLSTSVVTSLNHTLNGSRVREGKREMGSSFAELCEFAQTLPKPRWLVRFPLVLPSPKVLPPPRKSRPSSQSTSVRHSTSSLPKTRVHTAVLSSQPATIRQAGSRSKSQEALEKVKTDCENLRSREIQIVRRQRKGVISLKRQLKTCGKHASLISYSNSKAPYFLLLHKFSVKKHIYE